MSVTQAKKNTRNFPGKAQLEQSFTLYKVCSVCGVGVTYKYRKMGTTTEIWVMPTSGMFSKKEKSVTVYSGRLANLSMYL